MKLMNSVKNTSLREFLATIAISLCTIILASCGDDDSSTSSASYNMEVFSDVSKLPKCTKSNEGEMAWVKGEKSARVCVDEKWYSTVGSDSTDTFSCSTEKLKDKNGVKIICNGDSVGVVFNGKDGSDGKNGTDGKNGKDGSNGKNGLDGIGCSISKIDEQKVRVICGKDSTILFVGSESDVTESSQTPVVVDSEKVAVSLNEVSGVSQKGPFLSGSRVLIREMEDGRTLMQTGNSFNGKILNDKGEFKIKARMLVSQYVMLEASGYYRNEITGENSSSELTLFAITDVNDRNTVNINLLTHLEYERVIYLVTQKKMKVQAAKKQAQKEVLDLLDIDATDFSNSEDLNIAGGSDEDGALLAFSIILQGDRSVSLLSELLQKIANDMEEDGKWDNTSMRASLADWAAQKELDGKMVNIRKNVTNWKLSSIVPNFEKHIHNFWTTEYGLGKCSSENEGKILQNSNKLSQTKGSYFICKSGKWTSASSIEYDTDHWTAGKDGDCKTGDVNSKNCYVYENKIWRSGNSNDCTLKLRGCTALRQDTVGLGSDKIWYKCDAKTWRVATNIEKDTATWGAGKFDGEVRVGQVNKGIYYIYEIGKKTWRNATTIEKDTYDYKTNKDWTAGKDGEIKKGSVTDTIYVFDKTVWRVADDIEEKLGGCVTAIQDSVGKVGNTYYVCKSGKWSTATQFEYDTYRWIAGKDGEIKKGNVTSVIYVYDKDVWKVAGRIEGKLGGCVKAIQDSIGKVDEIYYKCNSNNVWEEASEFEYDTYRWEKGENGEIRKGNVTDSVYVYYDARQYGATWQNASWRLADSIEKVLGGCIQREVYTSNNSYYYADSIGVVNGVYYICGSGYDGDYCMQLSRYGSWESWWDNDWTVYDEECKSTDNGYDQVRWRHAIARKYDTYKRCSEFGTIIHGSVNTNIDYMCLDVKTAVPYDHSYDNDAFVDQFEDGRNGKIYRTMKYRLTVYDEKTYNYNSKELVWMIDDLDYVDDNMRSDATICYGTNCEKGRGYTWAATVDSVYWAKQGKTCGNTQDKCELSSSNVRGICPEGWHVPNNAEWAALSSSLSSGSTASAKNIWWYRGGLWWSTSEVNDGTEAWVVESINQVFDWCSPCLAGGKSAYNKIRCVKDDE